MKTLGKVKFALSHSSVKSPLSHDYAVASLAVVDVVPGIHSTRSPCGSHSPAAVSIQQAGQLSGVVGQSHHMTLNVTCSGILTAADVGLDDGSSASRLSSTELTTHFRITPKAGLGTRWPCCRPTGRSE
ncbi:hypothetical protein FA95DRAFT_213257 [Auriscalpium vulgare]|uniref:Uncharacterized protein n=1 Tax=Auriscalpium vulgare TaxID=40419 RepID=A0ACB8RMD8_9AGAM|nr:hypothetical protein FA95DRAFT_213257 [Auriscalpium vulgare]